MEIFNKIIPIIVLFLIGYVLKIAKLLSKKDGDVLLKIVFFISLPALILLSITRIEINMHFLFFPVISAMVILAISVISYFIGKILKLERKSMGVFLAGTMIMNIGFLLPFVIAGYGDEGLGRLLIFDLSNGLLCYTLVYYIACKHGSKKRAGTMAKKFLISVPLWALVISVLLNFSGIKITGATADFLETIGDLTIPLIMLALGLYFSPKIIKPLPILVGIIIRIGIGFTFGYFLSALFDLEGLDRIIVILASAAPVGYNTIVFSSLEELDKEFAAALVSFSIIIGMILIPVMILILE